MNHQRNEGGADQQLQVLGAAGNIGPELGTEHCCHHQQRLYFIRTLRKAGLNHRPLTQADGGLVESVLCCTGVTVWYGNTTLEERKALQRVIQTAERITGTQLPSIETIYTERCQKRGGRIMKDLSRPAHSLLKQKHCSYNLRHKRADSFKNKTGQFFNSFFPATARLMAGVKY